MKTYLLFLALAVSVLFACNSEKSKFKDEIAVLEQEVEEQATAQSVTNLFDKYEQYVKDYPDDEELCGRYLYRSAGLAYRAGNYVKTGSYLERGIKEFPGSSITPDSRMLLGTVYDENLNASNKAKEQFQYLIDNHPNHAGIERAQLSFKPEDEKRQTLIRQKEEILNDEAGNIKPRIAADLYQKYTDYVERFPDDKGRSSDYLLKSGKLLSFMNNPAAASKALEKVIEDYPDSKSVPESRLTLAGLYDDHLNQSIEAQEQAQIFVQNNPDHPDIEKAKYFLQPEQERLDTRIKEFEAELYPDNAAKIDLSAAGKLIRKYETYARKFPKDDKSPDYLYKAGEVARSSNNIRKAVELLEKLYDDHRGYEKAPEALFLAGFIYENDLKNLDKAKELYNTFIKKYPEHELAKSVEFSIQNLGVPPDEIIKSFEDKKKDS